MPSLRSLACRVALCGWLCSCQGPPPNHALPVRDLAGKCALIAFSGCAALMPEPADTHGGEHDAVDRDAAADDAGIADADAADANMAHPIAVDARVAEPTQR